MADNSEKFEFDVETGKLKRGIEDLIARMTRIKQTMSSLSKSSSEWTNKQYVEMGLLAQQHHRYAKEVDELRARLKSMLGTQQQGIQQNRMYAQSTRDLNVTFLSLGYAIDDFLTVWSMRKDSMEGILAGAGAAANNFSVILAQMLPGQTKLLAFMPALAVAVAKVGYSFFKTSGDVDAFKKRIEDAREVLSKFQEETEKATMGQEAFGNAASLSSLQKAQQSTATELAALEAKRKEIILNDSEVQQYTASEWDALSESDRKEIQSAAIIRATANGEQSVDVQIADARKRLEQLKTEEANFRDRVRMEDEKKRLEGVIEGSGVADALNAVIKKKLSEGMTADAIVAHLQSQQGMEMFSGKPGEQALRGMIWESQGNRFQGQYSDLAAELGPEAMRLEEMKRQEEDLRNKIDESRRGAPGQQRAPKRETRRLQQELDALQTQITEQERRAEEEEKLTRDGYFLGDKLDRISALLASYLRESLAAGVPLANPRS